MKNKTDTRKYLPSFKSDYLQEVVDSFRKRHQSIKRKCGSISCEKVIEREDGETLEILEFEFRPISGMTTAQLRIYIWSERWIFVGAHNSLNNSRWEWTVEGRLVGAPDGATIIEKIETSIGATFYSSANSDKVFRDLWGHLVAKGPKSF